MRPGFGQFNTASTEFLQFAAQYGGNDVLLNTPLLPGAQRWELADLVKLRLSVEQHGLKLMALENVPTPFYDHIMLNGPRRDEQIDNVSKHPISDDEIKRAKDSILNGFVFNLDSPDKILRERMAYEFYGYPQDYLEKFRAGVEKVAPADVARVATKYLHKDQLAVMVVGHSSEFDKPLPSLGPVTKIDISIPPPPGEPGPAAKPAQ